MRISHAVLGVTVISVLDRNSCSEDPPYYTIEVSEFFYYSISDIDIDGDIDIEMEQLKDACAYICFISADQQTLRDGIINKNHDFDYDLEDFEVNYCEIVFNYESIVALKQGEFDLGYDIGKPIGAVRCSVILPSFKHANKTE